MNQNQNGAEIARILVMWYLVGVVVERGGSATLEVTFMSILIRRLVLDLRGNRGKIDEIPKQDP